MRLVCRLKLNLNGRIIAVRTRDAMMFVRKLLKFSIRVQAMTRSLDIQRLPTWNRIAWNDEPVHIARPPQSPIQFNYIDYLPLLGQVITNLLTAALMSDRSSHPGYIKGISRPLRKKLNQNKFAG